MDVGDDSLDRGFELLALHVRGELGGLRDRRALRRGNCAAQALAGIGDRGGGALVCGVDPTLVIGEGAGHDRQLVAQVVEDEQQIGHHQRHVGQSERVGIWLAERLDRAHQVIAEEADRAAGKRGQALDRRELEGGEMLGNRSVRIGGVGGPTLGIAQHAIAPAQHRARPEADEGVATDLPLLGRLEQEAGSPLGLTGAQLEESGDGRLAVVEQACADRHHVAVPGQGARLLQARFEPQLGLSGDGH